MGLSERLARVAARRPHVLLVPVPGARHVRWAGEDALDALGWARAASPAAADILLCCGDPGPQLAGHVKVAWDGLPGPRVCVVAVAAHEVLKALRSAPRDLADLPKQREDARTRLDPPLSAADKDDKAAAGGGEHGEHGESDMDMGSGSGNDMRMDMGPNMNMNMNMPGGLVMADRVEDRDGLRLEGLHLSLGPLLPGWPAGLRLDVELSGDVLTRADVLRLDPQPEQPAPPAVLALDALALLLEAAGWSDGALRARRARAEGGTGPLTEDVLRRLRRARLLRWSLRGLPAPSEDDLVSHLDRLTAVVRGEAASPAGDDGELASRVVGLDVGTAALVVAASGPLPPVPAVV